VKNGEFFLSYVVERDNAESDPRVCVHDLKKTAILRAVDICVTGDGNFFRIPVKWNF
jgi:hypothetical protein